VNLGKHWGIFKIDWHIRGSQNFRDWGINFHTVHHGYCDCPFFNANFKGVIILPILGGISISEMPLIKENIMIKYIPLMGMGFFVVMFMLYVISGLLMTF